MKSNFIYQIAGRRNEDWKYISALAKLLQPLLRPRRVGAPRNRPAKSHKHVRYSFLHAIPSTLFKVFFVTFLCMLLRFTTFTETPLTSDFLIAYRIDRIKFLINK